MVKVHSSVRSSRGLSAASNAATNTRVPPRESAGRKIAIDPRRVHHLGHHQTGLHGCRRPGINFAVFSKTDECVTLWAGR